MKKLIMSAALFIAACDPAAISPARDSAAFVDLSKREKPAAIVQSPWIEVLIGVPDFDDVPNLFTKIGGFTERYRDSDTLVLGAPGTQSGLIRFELTKPDAITTRPFGSRSWDTGCYFSTMMRAKNTSSIIKDTSKLGWEPLTPMAYLEFGPSQLNVVVLGHKDTGIQIQIYERLTTPLPEAFPGFERLSRPFNIMQMVRNRDAVYDFYQQGLGFDTFFYGKPYTSKTAEIMPLGIPKDLTTTTPYKTGIMTPKTGLEVGRMEMIQVQMPGGKDLARRCEIGNIGITDVRFEVPDLNKTKDDLTARGLVPEPVSVDGSAGRFDRQVQALRLKTPDGANITFLEAQK